MPGKRTIARLLVANRGEIALRVMRTCREMGIEPVAVYGNGEESAPHVRYADDAWRLRDSAGLPYLDIQGVVEAARAARVDAIHPGYGFLAENAEFARALDVAGILFVGPSAEAIASMGDKVEARRIATAAGLRPVPGTTEPVRTVEEAIAAARATGYPVAVKAAGGGGGRGFRVARGEQDLAGAFHGSSGEAERYFSNPEVYLERYLEHPRHIEVQVMADTHGNVVALGERDCSIQRRHQKLVEETPSPAVAPDIRAKLLEASRDLARSVDYVGAGTVEYLLDASGDFYFLEMNTRIQVEHTITEMVTGIDLVREQIAVATGEPLSVSEADVFPRGWAIECRINAEDAGRDFAPAPGRIGTYSEPGGFGVRVDGALGQGDEIQPRYDSLIAKLVAWGRSREEAILRMTRALGDFSIGGVPTTIPFHQRVMRHPEFRAGRATTTFLVEYPEVLPSPAEPDRSPAFGEDADAMPLSLVVEVNGRRFETSVRGLPAGRAPGPETKRKRTRRAGRADSGAAASGDDLVSPIHGTVIGINVAPGDQVEAGQVICVVEAMKMENELAAHKAGTIASMPLEPGASVSIGQVVATITS
jgi:acetyl-CoA/propionyl-CoA carboxylase biotin carboxyl carrier protein